MTTPGHSGALIDCSGNMATTAFCFHRPRRFATTTTSTKPVVLDINLNGESGVELGHHLKLAGISLPVIYITGNDSNASRKAAMGSGCLAYLTKPFSAKSLIASIEQASAALA